MNEERVALVEALLFAYGEPLSLETLTFVSKLTEEEVKESVVQLEEKLKSRSSGLELVHVAQKFQLRTKPEFGTYLLELKAGAPRRLTAQALETLSVIAYRQPVVKSEVEKIRGVDSTPTLKTLLDRDLIKIIGHQETVGQPALYATTDEFLKLFGLASIAELPTLRELKEIIGDPGESGLSEEITVETAAEIYETEQVEEITADPYAVS